MSQNELFEILKKVRILNNRLDRIKIKMKAIEDSLYPGAVRYDKDKVQTSPSDQMSAAMAELSELSAEYNRIDAERRKAIEQTEQIISTVPDVLQQMILRRRYIVHYRFSDIAEELHYSEEWIYKNHQKAIEYLSEQYSSVQF